MVAGNQDNLDPQCELVFMHGTLQNLVTHSLYVIFLNVL